MRIQIEAIEHHPARHMDFADVLQIELCEQRLGIKPVIAAVDVEIVQVQQQAAAAFIAKRIQERRLVHLSVWDLKIVNVVLEEKRHWNLLNNLGYAWDEQIQSFTIAGQRHGYAYIHLPALVFSHVIREMIAVPGELKPIPPPADLSDMVAVEIVSASDRKSNAMGYNGPRLLDLPEVCHSLLVVDIPRLFFWPQVRPQDVRHDLDKVEIVAGIFNKGPQRGLVGQAHAEFRKRSHLPHPAHCDIFDYESVET